MIELPTLLLQHGIELRKHGQEYSCKCFAHDDKNPSMSVYINGNNKWVSHCHACGWHGDNIDVQKFLSGNDDHRLAVHALQMGEVYSGRPFAAIIDGDPVITARSERKMIIPTQDNPLPTLPGWINSLKHRNGQPLGKPVKIWTFRTSGGLPWYYEARYEITDEETGDIKKEPRVFTYAQRGEEPAKWSVMHHPSPRPIYGLDRIAQTTGQVIIGEGPNKAEAIQQLFPSLAATGWTGGAKAWSKSDWSPVAGRTIILWPDADEPGRTAMAGLAQHLITLGCTCYILDTSDLAPGWDAADAVREGWTGDKALAFAKARKGQSIVANSDSSSASTDADPDEPSQQIEQPAQPSEPYTPKIDGSPIREWPGLIDILKDHQPPSMPDGIAPQVMMDYVTDRSEVIGSDPAACLIGSIVCAAALIDDRITLRINEGYEVAPRLWGCVVGAPSSKKTPALDAAMLPMSLIISRIAALDAEAKDKQAWADKKYSKAIKDWESAALESGDETAPKPLAAPRLERHRLKLEDATIEAAQDIMRDLPRGALMHRDELSAWLSSMDQYKNRGGGERASWLKAWDGGTLYVDRIGRGSFTIPNWGLSVLGGIQPDKISRLDLTDDGLLQRFIIVSAGKTNSIGADRNPNRAITDAWLSVANHLYDTKPSTPVTLSPEANAEHRAMREEIERLIELDIQGPIFSSVMGKYSGLSARIALVYHCIECATQLRHPSDIQISGDTMRMATKITMDYILLHAHHFYNTSGMSANFIMARHIANIIIDEKLEAFTPSHIHNRVFAWRGLSENDRVATLDILERNGWIRARSIPDYGKRIPAKFETNPAIEDLRETHAANASARMAATREIVRKITEDQVK